ncbi:unnamed protein product [Blepharisma stoltei]|uniref:Uncharacterized protein n=1 Tax=Blepharisma stoltei TaxID=1481888 RepID=A0AAU9JAN2_9CILI|nr:unnamed protein product [Blepharisma stoltei]
MSNRSCNLYPQSLLSRMEAISPQEFANYSHETQYTSFKNAFPEYINKKPNQVEELMKIRSITVFAKKFFEMHKMKFKQTITHERDKIISKVFIDGNLAGQQSHPTSLNRCRVTSAILAFDSYDVEILRDWMKMHKSDLEDYLAYNKFDD